MSPTETLEQDLWRSASLARDVIESYRGFGVLISGWESILREAIGTLSRLSGRRPDLVSLVTRLQEALDARLRVDPATMDRMGRALGTIVSETRVPGIPQPEDKDWTF